MPPTRTPPMSLSAPAKSAYDAATRHPVFFTSSLRKLPFPMLDVGGMGWSPVASGYVVERGRRQGSVGMGRGTGTKLWSKRGWCLPYEIVCGQMGETAGILRVGLWPYRWCEVRGGSTLLRLAHGLNAPWRLATLWTAFEPVHFGKVRGCQTQGNDLFKGPWAETQALARQKYWQIRGPQRRTRDIYAL